MAKLNDKVVLSFNGGVRQDKSEYQLNSNELVKVINFDLRNAGEAKVRGGSHMFGQKVFSNPIDNSFYYEEDVSGTLVPELLINERTGTDVTFFKLRNRMTRLTAELTTASSDATVDSTTGFGTGPAQMEIDGDEITYASITDGTTFGTVSGVAETHAVGAAVHQFESQTEASDLDGTLGIYYALLGNVVFIQGRAGAATYDGATMTNVADGDEPDGIYATTYRQKIYTNRLVFPTRTYYSAAGDATSWDANDFFEVEGSSGEIITGYKASPSDELLIFKTNSTWAYNEVTLKERSSRVGAFGHRCVQEVGGLIYTFCPAGVFATNGREFRDIGEPVKEYLKGYEPVYDTTVGKFLTNAFAAAHDGKYILYIGDITYPETLSGVALVYDTEKGTWTVWTGLTNLTHLRSHPSHVAGGNIQRRDVLFGGDTNGRFYRFFTDSYVDADDNVRLTGSEIKQDFIVDGSGTPISAELCTKLYDMGTTALKRFRYIRVLTEDKGFHVSFRYEDEMGGLTNWKSLGEVRKRNQRFTLPSDSRGYRIAVKFTYSDANILASINGVSFEETETLDKR